jgi:WD40 repeat protein
MAKQIRRIAAVVGMATPFLLAQQGSVSGPVSGYVFDRPAHVLRPVLGIAGAAVMGGSVDFGMTVAAAYVSPRQESALVVGTDRSLHLFKINAGVTSEVPLNGSTVVPDGVAFSPSGSAAALYAAGRVQIVSGLPSAPVLSGVLDARPNQDASALTVRPHPHHLMASEMFAVSDDGALLLVASDSGVRVMQSSGGSQSLMDGANGALIAFAPGGHDAAAAVPNGAGLVVLRDVGGSATRQALATASDIESANGVAFSTDGKKVYVARSKGGVALFDVASQSRTDIACDCVPFGLVPMGNLYRLNELGSGPLWLLDPSGAAPRIVFVPAKTN